MTTEVTFTYPAASTASDDAVRLVTEVGTAVFFDGFAEHPAPAAQSMLCVARVASSRFFMTAAMLAKELDPVVTAEPDRLRFESFSLCAGVHARFDLVEDGLDVRTCAAGTTNVDFNAPMREALSRITGTDPLRVTVGSEGVGVETLEGSVVERRVPLPERWVKGFGEVQVALRDARPLLDLDRVQAQRFLNALPGGDAGSATVWVLPSAAAPRITHTWQAGAVCLAGTSRLRTLVPLARFATGLRAYGDPDADHPTAVAWVLTVPGGRLCLTLSPDTSRGFSGEGGLLLDLASDGVMRDAEALASAVATRTRFGLREAAADANLTPERAAAALAWLGVHGRIGFDAVDQVYFSRHLPFPEDLLRRDPPRLRDARALVDGGAVEPLPDGEWRVVSGGGEYRASVDADGFRCSCPWVAKHGTSRGPCKHVLAGAIAARALTS